MAKNTKSKSAASTASSWWAERSKILASLKPKSIRARPKIKKAKAKSKRIQAKKPVKAKKVTKMKKATKGKKGKAKRAK